MKRFVDSILFLFLAGLLFAAPAQAGPVGYAAQLHTTKLKPVTNVLILEQDKSGTVHGTVHGSEVPGSGQAVVRHNPAFTPVRSLVVGITDGLTPEGTDKTQIIVFLNKTFAASIAGVKWSDAFPGSSHSATIASLIAATAGDAAQLAWFTDSFFKQIAAAAVFETGADFAVGEFSAFDKIGDAVTAGSWLLNAPIVLLGEGAGGTVGDRPTALVDETATDSGPFDVQLQFVPDPPSATAAGSFGVTKTVVNGTGRTLLEFTVEIGTGLGGAFVPGGGAGAPQFSASSLATESTGAFPDVTFGIGTIVFRGRLDPGETAIFSFIGITPIEQANDVTVRQRTLVERAATQQVPSLSAWAMIALMVLLAGLASWRLRSPRLPG